MCQLLGINAAAPTDFRLTFRGFCQRGGCTDVHAHGWGLAIYEGRGLRTFLDPQPCCNSAMAGFVEQYPILTYNMMAHIRYATQGSATLENVHPFHRELWGINWCFAHNGSLPLFSTFSKHSPDEHPLLGITKCGEMCYHAVGDTDSEAVFCAILSALKAEFKFLPTLPLLFEALSRLCHEIVSGCDEEIIFNLLLGCGEHTIFAYSWPGSRPGSEVWNGLYYIVHEETPFAKLLTHTDYSIEFPEAASTRTNKVAMITTKPLTNEDGWIEMHRGELLMFDKGMKYTTSEQCQAVEQEGRGLCSKCLRTSSSMHQI